MGSHPAIDSRMKLGIMQPYFFPYLGYFELIAATDRWVVFDVVQYNPKSWMMRNRILHPSESWQYFGLTIDKSPKGTLIRDIQVKDPEASLSRCLGQLEHYRKRAPHYAAVRELIRDGFAQARSRRLVDINIATLIRSCQFLDIDFHWSLCSEMDLNLENIAHAGQWALRIAEQLGASHYLNPPGGREIFQASEWTAASIGLHFTEIPDFQYAVRGYDFIANLSIIDLLMWNTPGEIKTYMTQHLAPVQEAMAGHIGHE